MARFRFNAYRRKARGTPRPNDRQVDAVQDPTPAPNLPKSDSSALVDCIPCPALLVDQERRIDAVNLPLCDAFGFQGAFLNIGEKFVDFACRTSLFGRTELLALGDFLSAEGNRRQIEIVASNGMTFNARACDMTDGRVLITLEKILSKGPTDGKKIADSVIENLPGAVLRLTHRRHHRIDCIFASPRSPELFGCSMGEITGPDINFLDLVADEYRSAFETAMMKGTHKTTAIDMEIQIRNGTVGPLWVRSVGVAVPGPDGSVLCDLRMINVEDRRKLQEERQRLERLLNLVIDNIPSMVSVRNADDRSYLVVNRAYEEMTGHSRQDLIGRSDIRLFKEVDTTERDHQTRKMLENDQVADLPEIRVNVPGKGSRIVKTRKFPLFDKTGRISYILAIIDDVTEQRETENALRHSEQRFRDAIESLTDGIALYDADERLVLSNERYRALWPHFKAIPQSGIAFEDMVRGYLTNALKHGQNIDVESEVKARLARYRNRPSTSEVAIYDGRWLQVNDRSTADGGVVVTCTDITAQKEREKSLRHASRQALHAKETAEGASRSKSDFLANMSHELRTPLNAVIGFSEIIKNALLGDESIDPYKGYAQDIYESGHHLLSLINDILDMSKIEAGKLELYEEKVVVAGAIDSSIRLVQERAHKNRISLSTDIPEDLPELNCDLRKFKQITINLLSNAVKFTPEGGCVTTRVFVGANGEIYLRITDTGIGICEKDLKKVLEPFGQAEVGHDRQYEGTGLGLPLTKALTELHGGRLEIESNTEGPERGTTVTAIFPKSRMVD